jgi:hypothetical protein
MTLALIGSSVYLIFAVINSPALSPVTGSKYANDTSAIGKADGKNAAFDLAETEIAFFSSAVSEVLSYDTAGVSEGVLCQRKRYPMFFLVFGVLGCIPLKPKISLAQLNIKCHIKVWRFMCVAAASSLTFPGEGWSRNWFAEFFSVLRLPH